MCRFYIENENNLKMKDKYFDLLNELEFLYYELVLVYFLKKIIYNYKNIKYKYIYIIV